MWERVALALLYRSLLLAGLLLAALLEGADAAPARLPLGQATIHLTDLRPGYVTASSAYRNAATMSKSEPLTVSLLSTHGWLGGYDNRFVRSDNKNIQVGAFADLFSTPSGAHWWYEGSLLRVPAGYEASPQPLVGNESTGVQSSAFAGIIFRRGSVVIDVFVSTLVPSAAASALYLARAVDARILLGPVTIPAKIPGVKKPTAVPAQLAFPIKITSHSQRTGAAIQVTIFLQAPLGAHCSLRVTDTAPARNLVFTGLPWIIGRSGVVSWE